MTLLMLAIIAIAAIAWFSRSKERPTLMPMKRPHVVLTGAARGLGAEILKEMFKSGDEM